MPSAVVQLNPKQSNNIDCIFVDFFTKTCNKSLCWLCEHRGLPPNSFNNHMVDAVVLSEYLSGSGAWWRETEGVIKRE